jgi:hypothetical protein
MGRRRVTMSELARRTGIGLSTLRRHILADKLTASDAVKISAALKIDIAALIDGHHHLSGTGGTTVR